MPAVISHYLQAERVLDIYLKHGGVPVDRDAFLWGAQGPDFLFCQIFFPWRKTLGMKKLGIRMHRENPIPMLSAMRDYVAENPDDNIVRSYYFGFLCHYSLDRTAHPFVYAQVDALKCQYPRCRSAFLHSKIETALDVILLRYERGELPTEFRLKKAFPKNRVVRQRIASLYSFVCRTIYEENVSEKVILQTERDCRFLTGLQNDRTGLKKRFFHYFETKHEKYLLSCLFRGLTEDEDFDYSNILTAEWSWPIDSPQKRIDTFFQLFEASVGESVMFLQRLDEQTDLHTLFGSIPFS